MTTPKTQANTAIILDFETTGLSPACGDRAIEIGAVRLENGEVTKRFQSLMNPGMRINSFIESYTGITNAMLKKAPPCNEVMGEFSEFIADFNLVAHNASFDKKFLDAELHRIRKSYPGEFACSMLVSRRIYPDAPNHKLGTLVRYRRLPSDGVFHRALADADMTASLWLSILNDIEDGYGVKKMSFGEVKKLSKTSKQAVPAYLQRIGC